MKRPLNIVVLCDGKPGHENQSLGLAEAISRRTSAEIESLTVKRRSLLAPSPRNKPDLILGAGHSTHLPMVTLAKRTAAPSVVLMKPSLPLFLFDHCILPEHDLQKRKYPPHVIATEGALNRVAPSGDNPRCGGLILIGGPSSNHGWNETRILECVAPIVEAGRDRPWRITDSRRTPADTLDTLTAACPALVPYPHSSTGPEWLPQRLAEAAETWVTEDSVSMIYEALSSGTRVGLLPVPRNSSNDRVSRGVDRLITEGWVTPFETWVAGCDLPKPPRVLREADRVAKLILERLPLPIQSRS